MRISVLLVWHFLAWSISFWPLYNCFYWTVLCHYTIGSHKNFYKKPPNQKCCWIYCMDVVGDMVPTFHSILSTWTHGKNVSQPSKPRIAGLLLNWCFVFILWSSWVMSPSFHRLRARTAAHHKQQLRLNGMYLGDNRINSSFLFLFTILIILFSSFLPYLFYNLVILYVFIKRFKSYLEFDEGIYKYKTNNALHYFF